MRDVLVVEVLEHREAHHVAVEIHPAVHLAPADVAHHVVDVLQPDRARRRVLALRGREARQEHAAVVARARRRCGSCRRKSRSTRCALRRVRRAASRARARCARRAWWSRARPTRRRPPRARYRARRRRARGCARRSGARAASGVVSTKRILFCTQHVGGAVAHAGLGPAIRRQPEAERGAVVVRRLPRVADIELHVIGAVERKEILAQPARDAPMFAA